MSHTGNFSRKLRLCVVWEYSDQRADTTFRTRIVVYQPGWLCKHGMRRHSAQVWQMCLSYTSSLSDELPVNVYLYSVTSSVARCSIHMGEIFPRRHSNDGSQ